MDSTRPGNQVENLTAKLAFTAQATQALRKLSGWKKHYRIPDRYSDATEAFAAECAAAEIGMELDRLYDKLRRAFRFARRDLTACEPRDGTGTIITPYFSYSVAITLNRDRLDEVVWSRAVDAIKVPEQLASRAFGETFDGVFDSVRLALPVAVNIEDFLDAVEAAEIPNLTLDYDRSATYCRLRLSHTEETVLLTERSLAIVHPLPVTTHKLLESWNVVRKLVQEHELPLVEFIAPPSR